MWAFIKYLWKWLNFFIYFWSNFWPLFLASDSVDQLKWFFRLKLRYAYSLYFYYDSIYMYYVDRSYEENTDYKFNRVVWQRDKKEIIYLAKQHIFNWFKLLFTSPKKFFQTRAVYKSFWYNYDYFCYIVPLLKDDIYTISRFLYHSYWAEDQQDYEKRMGFDKHLTEKPVNEAKKVDPKLRKKHKGVKDVKK